jgi:hypothetical protein
MSDIPCQTLVDTNAAEVSRGRVPPRPPLLTGYAQKEQLAQEFRVSQRGIERWVAGPNTRTH